MALIHLTMTEETLLLLTEHLEGNETKESEQVVDKIIEAGDYVQNDHLQTVRSFEV